MGLGGMMTSGVVVERWRVGPSMLRRWCGDVWVLRSINIDVGSSVCWQPDIRLVWPSERRCMRACGW
eukprot:292023-Chlamydomonas_euryale.AAC.7